MTKVEDESGVMPCGTDEEDEESGGEEIRACGVTADATPLGMGLYVGAQKKPCGEAGLFIEAKMVGRPDYCGGTRKSLPV